MINIIIKSIVKRIIWLSFWYDTDIYDTNMIQYFWYGIHPYQSTDPANQPTNQPSKEATNQPAKQPTYQPTIQPIN